MGWDKSLEQEGVPVWFQCVMGNGHIGPALNRVRDTTTSLMGGNKLLCNMILEQRTAQLENFEAAQAFE